MSTATAANDITPNADVSSGDGIDTSPFLTSPNSQNRRSFRSSPSLQGAAGYLRRASSRRLMREPSMRVREAAAEQIEERQSDWAYSKPIVILDILWNLAFVIVSITVLVLSRNESPEMPLRLWIIGYALQSVLHMVCVVFEYRHRRLRDSSGNLNSSEQRSGSESWNSGEGNLNSESDRGESGDNSPERNQNNNETSLAKHLESANTMFSFVWWIIGFYWATVGGPNMISDAPQLYWLCITFLAFDVLFVVICVAVACIIGIAVCCCLPCIIAILYAVADQEGATKEDVERLPKYKFKRLGNFEKENGEIQESCGGVMVECDTDTPTELALAPEDAECCICLCSYEDGIELRELPCRHHFHAACIDKWLYINATCPLCKFNILRHGNQSGSEEA